MSSLRVFVAGIMLFKSYTGCSTSGTGSTCPSGTSEFATGFLLLSSCCLTVIRIARLLVHDLLTFQEHVSSLRVFVAGFVLFKSYTGCSTSGTGSTCPSGTSEFATGFCFWVRVV